MNRWEDLLEPAAAPGPHPLDAHEERARLRLVLGDGREIEGIHNLIGGRHFLVCHGPALPPIGAVEGPLHACDVLAVAVVASKAELHEQAHGRLHGPRLPGREPVTPDDFQGRLAALARAIATTPGAERQAQLRRQFHGCADRIALAAAKRAWILAEARWTLSSNAQPTMADLWASEVASPSRFARPRPQDYDPDPAIRRRRAPLPPAIQGDPRSVPNLLAALKAAGLKARVVRLGDAPHDAAHIQVWMPVKGRSHFVLVGRRHDDGTMAWRPVCGGNDTAAGLRRLRRAERTEAYRSMLEAVRTGRRGTQADLFA